MPVPIQMDGAAINLGQRVDRTVTVAASPTDATETVIATLTCNTDEVITEGVDVTGWAAYTVGATGTSGRLRIRKTSVAGTVVADSGAVTRTAAQLVEQAVEGFDSAPAATGQVYVLTLTVGAATAGSAVSACKLSAVLV